ncbi:MAG: F0F1 ATP synthase subunit A [Lewinellaceae bacterium]|nr:F0F1 ATP synthase subunit A [Saprospiraceae bacterium]MCB9337617.1 F0F1 ATP synthase subunit A [Lewinellaceae bacterium]
MRRYILGFVCLLCFSIFSIAQEHGHEQPTAEPHGDSGCGEPEHGEFNPGETAFHHISDQNIYSIGPFHLPLPCFLYAPDKGWSVFSSGRFHADAHGNGHMAVDGYVLVEGMVRRIMDAGFPAAEVEVGHHPYLQKAKGADGKEKEIPFVCYNSQLYQTEAKSTADGGLFGGGITSFYDFSITKNVVSMMLILALFAWMFISIANAYKKRDGMAPKGVQSFIEPIFLFIQDEVAKPFLGHMWEKYLPFLMSLFFFILGLNLFGQIPFLGGSNVTGNLAITMVLAIITFLVVNFNGNKHYWEHILWMPGVPAWVKTILTPVEILGVFIKPLTLMLRLFANITAGHMVVVIFVGLIFLFGKSGENAGASYGTAVGSTLLTLFMMSIELLVAFIQAFVFTILTASYIGAATEEAHH